MFWSNDNIIADLTNFANVRLVEAGTVKRNFTFEQIAEKYTSENTQNNDSR